MLLLIMKYGGLRVARQVGVVLAVKSDCMSAEK